MYRAGMVTRGQLVHGAYGQLVYALVGADEKKMDRPKEGMLQLTREWDRHEVERTRRVAQEVAEMQGMDSALPSRVLTTLSRSWRPRARMPSARWWSPGSPPDLLDLSRP